MPECIFCGIARNEIPCAKVLEDASVMAFLDINPAAKGHTLVIPKKHFESMLEIPDSELKAIAIALRRAGKAVLKATGAKGFNIVQSNGAVAGQVVMHAHFHVLPRFKGDGNGIEWRRSSYKSTEEAQKWVRAIKRHLK